MRSLIALFLLCIGLTTNAAAQTEPPASPTRADLAVTVGWLHVRFDELNSAFSRDHDWTHHATPAVTAGLYWNDHWKTELSVEGSNEATVWDTALVLVNGQAVPRSVNHHLTHVRMALTHLYQFGRNDWVHPSVGAGLLLNRRQLRSDYSAGILYGPPPRGTETVVPEEQQGPFTNVVASPLLTAGVKAYLTPRAFFRADGQVAFRSDIESVVFHVGFGIDF